MTPEQAARVAALETALRADHGDAVTRRGPTRPRDGVVILAVVGSRISATVEPDGGAWLTWADGTRSYNPPAGQDTAAVFPHRDDRS